jgi:hypothetical protein
MSQFMINLLTYGLIAVTIITLIPTIFGWVKYHGQLKPIWVMVLTTLTLLSVGASLQFFLFFWVASHTWN